MFSWFHMVLKNKHTTSNNMTARLLRIAEFNPFCFSYSAEYSSTGKLLPKVQRQAQRRFKGPCLEYKQLEISSLGRQYSITLMMEGSLLGVLFLQRFRKEE